jgi:hypothetical protein
MLVIQGDKSVADIYLGEFMRLFKHFQFRAIAAAARNQLQEADAGFLEKSDSWRAPFLPARYGPVQRETVFFAACVMLRTLAVEIVNRTRNTFLNLRR